MQELMQAEKTASDILQLYIEHGQEDYIGESISQIEHMCQCAQFAIDEGYDEEVVLAAFFHDIGHLYSYIAPVTTMNDLGAVEHEKLGADYLRELGFSEKIARLVEGHVAAKRYLTYSSGDYYAMLSEASKQTLELQGGKMNEQEAALFEGDRFFELHIKMRTWDDKGKQENIPLPSLNTFKELIVKHLISI